LKKLGVRKAVPGDWKDVISSIEDIIEDARSRMFGGGSGGPRNEGDLVIPAQMATPDAINFTATHGRGLICLTLPAERLDALGLSLMSTHNSSRQRAFTVSIEAREGVTTAVSAADRARTVSVAIIAKSAADIATRICSPYAPALAVLVIAGHTEAAVDISRRAEPVRCDLRNHERDGTMARLPDLVAFAQLRARRSAQFRPDRLSLNADNQLRVRTEQTHHVRVCWRMADENLCRQETLGDDMWF
jgi:3,4-dihydroxy 2-butanone 4-phosphate synthase/GTP cyclohydrolase II